MALRLAAHVALTIWLLQPAVRLVCASSCLPQPTAALAAACHESSDHDSGDSDLPQMTSSPACVDAPSAAPGLATVTVRIFAVTIEPRSQWSLLRASMPVQNFDRAPAEIAPPSLLKNILRI